MTDSTEKPAEKPQPPVDLEVLAERVRERLHIHGQHGALAEFAKYTAAVNERLSANETAKFGSTPVGASGTATEIVVAGRRGGKQSAKKAAKAKKAS